MLLELRFAQTPILCPCHDLVTVYYSDYIAFIAKCKKILFNIFIKFNENEKKIIVEINKYFQYELDIDINFESLFREAIIDYNTRYKYYFDLFEKSDIEKIIMLVAYGLGSILKAAKDNGIEVIEFQHGIFNKYHLGYSFPGQSFQPDFQPAPP